jgi:hypothetical protein
VFPSQLLEDLGVTEREDFPMKDDRFYYAYEVE